MSDKKSILVTGITGQQGGEIARSLLMRGHQVRGLSRKVDSVAAQALTKLGVEVVPGDFANPATLVAAATDVDSVFAMSTPFEAGDKVEVEQGVALVDAAVAAGVDHFVFTSVASADQNTGIPHFDSKYEVEKHLASTDLTWTVIAPVYFMENLLMPQTVDGLREGTYALALPADLALQQVAVADIGAFGAHVVENRDAFAGRRIDIASDEVSAVQSAVELADIVGGPVGTFEVPMEQIRSFSDDLALMFEWFISTGYSVDIEKLRADYPDVGWHRFGNWARRHVPQAINARADAA